MICKRTAVGKGLKTQEPFHVIEMKKLNGPFLRQMGRGNASRWDVTQIMHRRMQICHWYFCRQPLYNYFITDFFVMTIVLCNRNSLLWRVERCVCKLGKGEVGKNKMNYCIKHNHFFDTAKIAYLRNESAQYNYEII